MKSLVPALLLATVTLAHAEPPRSMGLSGARPVLASPGKPSAPVRITSSLVGTVVAEKDLSVVVTVTPTGKAKRSGSVRVRLRGVDGVVVVRGEAVRVPFKALTPLRVPGTVRVPKGVAGSLVVDVLVEVDGKHVAKSQAFELVATGAAPVPRLPGHLVTGSDGQEVLVLEPRAKP